MTQSASQADQWMIVGALSDLGRATAWQLAAAGKSLILVDQNAQELIILADELEQAGYAAIELAAIDPARLDTDCQQLSEQLRAHHLMLTGWVWTGYHLKTPSPMQHISLSDWQGELLQNLTYPYWLLRSAMQAEVIHAQTQVWFALPQAQAFSHALGLSSLIWSSWLTLLATEWGDNAPTVHLWSLPRIADRIHRRIWPLASLDSFEPLEQLVAAWMIDIQKK